jgi:hypothetical protein
MSADCERRKSSVRAGSLNNDESALVKAEILAGWGPSQPSPEPEGAPTSVERRFSVAIRDLSGADPNQVAQIVRRYASFDSERLQALPVTLHVGVPLVTGKLLIEDLAKAGVTADVVTSQKGVRDAQATEDPGDGADRSRAPHPLAKTPAHVDAPACRCPLRWS